MRALTRVDTNPFSALEDQATVTLERASLKLHDAIRAYDASGSWLAGPMRAALADVERELIRREIEKGREG